MRTVKISFIALLAPFVLLAACNPPEKDQAEVPEQNSTSAVSTETPAPDPASASPVIEAQEQGVQASPVAAVGKPSRAQPGERREREEVVEPAAAPINATALYKENLCLTCHGHDGSGTLTGSPDFTDAAWQRSRTEEDLIAGIKKGKMPKMPAYASKLSEDEVRALVSYIRGFEKK